MDERLRPVPSHAERLHRLGLALALATGLLAYRALFLSALPASLASLGMEGWFFMPGTFPPISVVAVAGWLLWRRRQRLRALPAQRDIATTAGLIGIGAGLFLWARLTGSPELLLPSLAANLLGFACATRGRAGCRALLLPALVLLLGLPLPVFYDELVWQLQRWTAGGAAWLLTAVGRDVIREGVLLQSGDRDFLVIESCSGLRGIQILTLVALVVREFFAHCGARAWLLVLVAPCLGYVLNVVRVAAVVMSSADPQALADHSPQGVAVLVVGTGLLYALGWGLAGTARHRLRKRSLRPDVPTRAPGWKLSVVTFAALAALAGFVSPLAMPPEPLLSFPREGGGWSSQDLTPDLLFTGLPPSGQSIYRRYERPRRGRSPDIVELFIGREVPRNRVVSRLFSSKLAIPGRGWSLEEETRTRVWALGVEADLVVASRDGGVEHALAYTWRVRDEGLWSEASRSLLALERSPFRREPPRAVVRLLTRFAPDGPVARGRARRVLDRFVVRFRDDLAGL